MGKIIGIDLGTTNSCVAVLDGSDPKVIENSKVIAPPHQSLRTPTTVKFWLGKTQTTSGNQSTKHVVRGQALNWAQVRRRRGAKRHKNGALLDCRSERRCVDRSQDEQLAPPQVSAETLKKMKKTAEDHLGEDVPEAVITVPAYPNDSQRQPPKMQAKSLAWK